MNRPSLNRAIRRGNAIHAAYERRFTLERELRQLAGVINAEFKSDPMAVQCFDLGIVARLDDVLSELDYLDRAIP